MSKKRNCYGTLLLFLFFILSCKKDKPLIPETDKTPEVSPKDGVFVVNEGNFQWSNASLGYYNNDSNSYSDDIFSKVNGRPLGDVFQSMEIINGKAYLIINNSGKVEVINVSDFKSVATINGFVSPRYIQGINKTKAYVTDYAANSIAVIDLNSHTIIKHIPCKGFTEELLLSNEKVFVTNLKSEYVYVINPTTDIVTDSIKTGYASGSIKKDKNGKLWILCRGESTSNRPGSLHRINPLTNQVEYSVYYQQADQHPKKLRINSEGDLLYFLNKGVCRISINNPQLTDNPFIDEGNSTFYGLGIEPVTGNIFISDAIDYIQKGKIMKYKPDGVLIESFNAGIIPGNFCFYQ